MVQNTKARLTYKLGTLNPSYGLEDKASAKVGLFTDYDGFFAYLQAIHKLGQYEDTGLTPEEIIDGQMFSGWISVKEQLPKVDKYGDVNVLVCMDDSFIATATYDIKHGWELWNDSGEVTHWMYLPKLPEEESNK